MRRAVLLVLALLAAAVLSAQEKQDALELYRSGNFQAAVEICRRELEEMPARLDAHAILGWSLLKLKRYPEALEASQKAFAVSRYDPRIIEIAGEAQYYLGYAREKAGDNRFALEAYNKALALNPGLVDAQRGKARVEGQAAGG